MIADILTVMWKEWRSYWRAQGRASRVATVVWLAFIAVLGPLSPASHPAAWLSEGNAVRNTAVTWTMINALVVASSTFVGERERRTLGTLLISRLPDRALVLGKVGYVVTYAWANAAVVVLGGILTANLAGGGPAFVSLEEGASAVVLSVLTGALLAAVGVFVSLRARTMQQATQVLGIGFFFVPVAIGIAVAFALHRLGISARDIGWGHPLLALLAVLTVANVAAYAVLLGRFRRGRLLII